ncbi:MAG: alcohol dehydrogenase catalytic domain-containing protein, partial [Enterococcus italicus]
AVVQLVRSEPQPLQADEVRIAISHVSVNPSDLIPITGAYAHRTPLPAVVGYEGVGTIVEVGSSELKELIGQRALSLDGGTWQRYVVSKREQLILVPNSLPDELACQMYINPLTAWVLCMEWMSLSPGETLLVNAANSAIGKLFLQLAQKKARA